MTPGGRPGEGRRLPPEEARFHFQNVPAEFRQRLIEELKARPEFTKVCDAAVQGAGVSLSMTLPEPVEFTCDGCRFHAFAWMGQIHVMGEIQSLDPLPGREAP